MAKVEIRKNGAGGGGGGTPVVFTSVTYAQLVAIIGASGLTQGSFYLITDFQTIYDQPDFDNSGNPKISVSTLSGSVEPIFVQAVSSNEISNQALSSVYENDELLYDWTFQTTEITGSTAKGFITRRTTDNFLNGKRNSTPYDSREVLFKRYESVSGSGIYNSYKDTGFASSNVSTFGNNSTDNIIGNFWNNDVLSNVTNYPFVLPNTVFGDNFSFNTIGDQCFNITFGDIYCINNNIGNYFFNNTIGDNFQNNIIGNFFANNTIGDNFESNDIGNFFGVNYISFSYNFYPNVIGNYFTNNVIGDTFLNNTIGNNFKNNKISNYFAFNTITDNFQSNNIGNYFGIDSSLNVSANNISDNFKYNNIGDLFLLNTISTNFQYNNISDYFGFYSGNIIGSGFTNNTIGNYFENTIGNDFSRNNISALFGFSGRNIIGDNFQNNTIGAESDSNTIGDNFKDNIFGSNFSGNTIGIDCQKNTGNSWFNGNNIGTGFQYNFLGNWFKGNTVGNSVTYLNIDANFDTQNIANNFTTKDWVAGLTTGFVSNTNGFLESSATLTGYVPYTGATTNVDLGTYNLTADHISLNVSPSGAGFVVGTTQWNNTIGSSETLLKGGSVVLKNGVDLVVRVVNKAVPNQTLTKAQYQVVKVSGATGGRLSVDLAQGDIDLNSADTLGVVTETIATNQEGFIMAVGQLSGINTTGSLQGETWADGDVLYLSPTTAGAMTNVKPNGLTGHIVVLGYVEYAHINQGSIYVKTMNGWELDELHNVYINPATLANNNVLAYNSTSQLWENETIAQVITLTTTGTSGASTLIGNTLNIPQYAPLPFIPFINDLEVFRGRTFRFDSTTVDTYGGINTLNNASSLAVLPNTTNFGNRYTRLRYYASIVSTGRVTSIRSTDLQWFLSGGFRFISTWRVADTAFGSTCQNFHGLIGTTSEIAVGGVSLIQVSTLTNCIFIGSDGSDANLQIMHNDSTGTCTKIDLGIGFPSNRTAGSVMTQMYSCELYNEIDSISVLYRVINLESGEVAQGTITTNLPDLTQGLAIQSARVMGTATTNTGQWEQHKWGCSDIIKNI